MNPHDEILAPKGCARCGHAFLPARDRLAFCPRCHAPHHGLAIPDGVAGSVLLDAWLRANGAASPVERAPIGFSLHRSAGNVFIIHYVHALTTPSGFSVLIERGGTNSREKGSPYTIVRLAGFSADPAPRPAPSTPLGSIARPQRSAYGLEVVATGGVLESLRALGVPAALRDLDRTAQALGLEPVHPLRGATLTEIPPELSGELARNERTIRCGSCGAPAALRLLANAPETRCPYCTQPVRVPPELQRELEGHRRKMLVQDAMPVLNGDQLWGTWQAAAPDQLACAVCGAPSTHREGALDQRCGHCGAMIIPSAEQLEQDVHRARQASQALLARREDARRKAKARIRTISARAAALNLGLFVLGGLIAVGGSLGLAFKGDLERGPEALLFLGLPLLAYVVIPGGLAFYVLRRTIRQGQRWVTIFANLAEQLDGLLLTHDERRGWLHRWWSSPTRESQMYGPSGAAGAVAAQIDGLQVLIDSDAEGDVGIYRGAYGKSWTSLLIAASWPNTAGWLKTMPGVRLRREAIERAGFWTVLRRDGLEVQATPATIQRLARNPPTAAALVPVLYEALRVATLLGARPPRPRA